MYVFAGFAGLNLLVSFAQAQNSTSAYVEPSVPTGTPIPGNYTGALRPQIHYSPPRDFMVCPARPSLYLQQQLLVALRYSFEP